MFCSYWLLLLCLLLNADDEIAEEPLCLIECVRFLCQFLLLLFHLNRLHCVLVAELLFLVVELLQLCLELSLGRYQRLRNAAALCDAGKALSPRSTTVSSPACTNISDSFSGLRL